MKNKRVVQILVFVILVAVLAAGVAMADDGQMMIRNVSKSPHDETLDAAFGMMDFYVPAQASNGAATAVEYYAADGTLDNTREFAVPLFTFYLDGVAEEEEHVEDARVEGSEIQGGASFGSRDAFLGVSLDDGTTWKRMNISNSAHLTSFTLDSGVEFPGDVFAGDFAVAGDKVFAAWLSRYCLGGTAAYTILDDLGDPVYPDYFGVAGAQGSVDYTLQGFPEVGQVPFGCVWTARGQLVAGDDAATAELEQYHMVWTKPERLTSGRRDANRLEVAGVEGAGFALVWQEDPKGLRPGTGLGPGEGWSGAIVNAKTDIWYSYADWNTYDLVCDYGDEECTEPILLSDYGLDNLEATAPKVAEPMLVPVRVTDNNNCVANKNAEFLLPYCYTDFDSYLVDDISLAEWPEIPETIPTLSTQGLTFCDGEINWISPGGGDLQICATEDGRVLLGRVGASRPRIGMHGYDSDGDDIIDSAWVILGYEETKALGEGTADATAAEDSEDTVNIIDIGKNLWYHSFDIAHPDIVSHGNILNQPAMDPLTNDFFETVNTDEDANLGLGDYAYDFYETEIARRFSLISQDWDAAGPSGMVAFTLVKQGIINQGGPADIYGQRFVLPDDFDKNVDNPYAFENMACDLWAFNDGTHPYYPKGICLDTPTNLSATVAVACEGGDCPTLETVYVCDDDGTCDFDLSAYDRVVEWSQCGPDFGGAFTACNMEDSTMDDQSWENPFDIAKGHRGFADGDFIQVLYAWSPNYKENAVGHDHYNLYVRRSFDGGLTWTTLPASFSHTDGVTYSGDGTLFYENYGWNTTGGIYSVPFDLGPGDFEPARNVSQLIGSRETILDPRYSPTADTICEEDELTGDCTTLYDDDVRDPSKFFIVYETGDNTTVLTGEATPLDLFYSRAVDFGDDYDVVEYVNSVTSEVSLGFDWLEKGESESGEASIAGNPGGTKFYAAWNQALEIGDEVFTDMDAYFRRVIYFDDVDGIDYAPITSILYISQDWISLDEIAEDDMLVIIGAARDGDHIDGLPADDIAEVQWLLDGQEVDDGDDEPRRLNHPMRNLDPGWHNFTFKAKDKGGRWSPGADVKVYVTEHTMRFYFPVMVPPVIAE